MDDTTTARDLDLASLIVEIGSAEFTPASFDRFQAAAFRTPGGRERLQALLKDWDEALAAIPTKTASAVLRGYGHLILGELGRAREVLEDAKRSEWGLVWLARTLLALNLSQSALAAAKDAHGKHPGFIPGAYVYVEALCRSGRVADTGPVMAELSREDGDSAEFAHACGLCQEKSGEYREAIDSYRKAVAIDPQQGESWFRLGYLLDLYGSAEEEDSDDAVVAYERCLKCTPIHTNAVINLGILYEDRERYHDAIKCFETVLKQNPNHRRAKLYLVDAIACTTMFYDREQEKKADRHSQVLKIPVSDFELSVRSRNCLAKMNIDTLGDLIMKTEQELLSYKNFGETSLQEIKDMLTQKGLRLGQGLEDQGMEPPSGRNPLEATVSSDVLDRAIEDLNLSVRSRRCMERLNVRSVRDLINKTEVELMSAKNFGMTSLNEIKVKLKEMGLGLRS